ncbi:carboxylesterase/lipase family protein [Myceligenerans xiligouense]|uniref:Carboxylic ester hydrolase n=1 Tax=Myceligenerans xiligouense TaxID=253184 RepID=A0A3N4ZN81_9MICO|nr:carboxylesterase family protein [Myceligenerans xiligouense]RPF21331.1 para-nitrobenzyl esterase [Myceligenerans xiligouense]
MEIAEQASSRTPRPGPSRRSAWFWVPLVLLVALVLVLGWLNKTPWWGWGLVAVLLVAFVLTSSWWLRRGVALRAGAWLVAGAVVAGTVVLAHPGPQLRVAGGAEREATQPVETAEGPVTGVRNDAGTVEIFAGVPYAEPPVGELRWQAPQPPEPRSEVLVADRFSAAPVQATTTFATRALSQTIDIPLEETFLNPYPVDEDSLYLNIWRPAGAASADLPVIVYVPGGGFATGSGALPLYDGEALASTGEAVVITINYRLGVLGFLSHPELAAESEYGASGNYGILDQVAALEWVRQNIAAFGGDPGRVTVAGESAGGESVCILGATPLAEGLVDGIIGSSGACMGTEGNTEDGDQSDSRAVAEDAGARLAQELGVDTVAELRELPVDRITEAAEAVGPHWRPSVDGYVLDRSPAEIYAAGDQLDVPTMVGSNADELSIVKAFPPESVTPEEYRATAQEEYGEDAAAFLDLYPGESEEQVLDSMLQAQADRVFTRAMYRWARLQKDSGEAPAYLYFFTHTPPDEGLQEYGAYHGAEVMYAFRNLGADDDADYAQADYLLRDQLSGYWLNFARTGDPNGAGLPGWSTFADAPEQVMQLGVPSGMAARPRPAAIDYWMGYRGPIA